MEQNLQIVDKDRQEYPLTDIVKLDATLNEILQKVPSTAEILVIKQQKININYPMERLGFRDVDGRILRRKIFLY